MRIEELKETDGYFDMKTHHQLPALRVPDSDWEWQPASACLSYPDIDFFASVPHERERAKRVCTQKCSVRAECLEFALENKEDHGVWGGMTPQERQVELRKRR